VKAHPIVFILASGLIALLWMGHERRTRSNSETGNRPQRTSPFFAADRKARVERPAAVQVPSRLSALKSLAENDPVGGLDELETLVGSEDSVAREEVFAWLARQPEDAASWIESLPDGALRNGVIERVLSEMAGRDPTNALAIAELLITSELRDAALTSALRRWATIAPVEALGAIASREEWRESSLLGRAFVAGATAHPRQIKELLAIIPPGALDNSFLASATELLLAKDPGAIPFWFESIEDSQRRSAIAETVLLHGGRNQPDLAFIWATQLPEPARRMEALQTSFSRAVNRDIKTAPALLDSPWLSASDRESLLGWLSSQRVEK
jgi:hypothetical protein